MQDTLTFNKNRPTSGRAVPLSKLIDRGCRVQSPVTTVDLAVRNFPWFSPKITEIRAILRAIYVKYCVNTV